MNTCPTGKRRHVTERQAKRFRRCFANGQRMRAYFCEDCCGFHLTSHAVPMATRRPRLVDRVRDEEE